ncbi:MAG: hypothetical protein Q4B28_04960 [bacterium]|nr:hypothetical protein [bacterium]
MQEQTSQQSTQQSTEQQGQGAPQFGYQTDEVYRKQRDAHIAQTLYTQNPNSFDYNTVYRYVRSEAQGVSDRDIHNTVRNIQSQYLQYGRLGAMRTGSVEKLREGLLNGQYSQSDLELLKTQDPERYNEYLAYEEKMNAMSNAKHNAMVGQKLMDGESVKEERKQEEILIEKAKEYLGVVDYKEEIIEQYKESLKAPEIQKHKNKMLDAQREMEEIDDSLDTLREDLMKQYPGIPRTQLNAILQDRSYKLLKRKNELHRDYIRSRGEVQFAVDMAGKNLEADLKGIEIQRMELSDKMQALGFAKGLMEFETPQQKRDAELEQIRKKAELQAELSDINSKDPKIQFNAVMQALEPYYKDFGSIILRPQAQAAQDIIEQAKREKISVGEAMRKNFTEPLQGKSGYKMLMNRQYGISNEAKAPQLVDIG